jgi:hypothetical protein
MLLINESLKEELAELEHSRWSLWMRHLFKQGSDNPDGTFTINADSVSRWKRQMDTDYRMLSATEKDSDRVEASKTIRVLSLNSQKNAIHEEAIEMCKELVPMFKEGQVIDTQTHGEIVIKKLYLFNEAYIKLSSNGLHTVDIDEWINYDVYIFRDDSSGCFSQGHIKRQIAWLEDAKKYDKEKEEKDKTKQLLDKAEYAKDDVIQTGKHGVITVVDVSFDSKKYFALTPEQQRDICVNDWIMYCCAANEPKRYVTITQNQLLEDAK